MAEAKKPGIVAKAQKRLSRTKTKVLQTLGKADRSTDETFDDLVQKTEKQHDVAYHLQKEIKTYVHCVRALSHASKALATALSQTYEEDWTEEAGFKKGLESLDLLWEDYLQSMAAQVIEPVNTYIASFPGLKNRVAKRRRKMMDYDNSRHSLETLQQAKKKDDAKIAKAQEDLNESKKIYEDLHNELCTELPDFYNSRVTFYADLFQKLFGCERTLHFETSRISESLNQICQNLSKDYVQFVYQPKRLVSKSLSDNSDEPKVTNGDSSPHQPSSASASPATTPTTAMAVKRAQEGAAAVDDDDDDDDDEDHFYGNQDVVNAAAKVNGDAEKVKEEGGDDEDSGPLTNNYYEEPPHVNDKDDDDDEEDADFSAYQSPPSNQPVVAPPTDTLYLVEATHTYLGEDVDELNFDPGDIIYVVKFDNDEEQDEGWQMGVKQKDGLKGVFPENFTRKL